MLFVNSSAKQLLNTSTSYLSYKMRQYIFSVTFPQRLREYSFDVKVLEVSSIDIISGNDKKGNKFFYICTVTQNLLTY